MRILSEKIQQQDVLEVLTDQAEVISWIQLRFKKNKPNAWRT